MTPSPLGWVIVVLVVCLVVVLVTVNTYLLIKWQHPEDSNEWMSSKVVIVFGLTIVELVVSGLPLDVANGSGSLGCSYEWGDDSGCARLDMEGYWYAVFGLGLVWLIACIPASLLAYEAVDEHRPWCEAVRTELVIVLGFGVLAGCMYAFLNQFVIPFREYSVSAASTGRIYRVSNVTGGVLAAMGPLEDGYTASWDEAGARLPATFFAYVTGVASWIGWVLFSAWGGVGLAALPLDLIYSYVHRPVPLDAGEVAEYRLQLQARTSELLEITKALITDREDVRRSGGWWRKRKRNAADRLRLNKLKQMVFMLETDIDDFVLCSTDRDKYEPLVYVGRLIAGIVALVHSLLWILHTILYVLVSPPASPFLNAYLLQFDKWYPLFGALACAVFSVYLLFATIKGCFKFGMRFFLLDLHPMKYNATYTNHALFNVALFIICSFPVAQFSTLAFAEYARFSDAATIFYTIENLTFFRIFFANRVFEYLLVICAALSAVYLILCPRDEPASAAKLKASLLHHQALQALNSPSYYPPHNSL
ncbi:hypothetical protein CTAYLR_010169 [Chrysophaeum taylorii]|uniref:LMBR1-like membrane protein n=1 Tax=Chrysophaeum taylorii TaxID=2483200 RepID=A0AAD7XQH2_9STRA|nr:hypothetical protein CTAYLR_010169 [Chrysophaeum taylorii]